MSNSIQSAITRTTGEYATGSATARNGGGAGPNIDAVAGSRVIDATNQARWRDSLYGGINNGLYNAASFQNGLFASLSLPPNGVRGGTGAGGVGGAVNGAGQIAKSEGAGGGAGAQNNTSTNPNNGGLSPSQLTALNQANKIPPELLAQMMADKTNKTEQRRDPLLKGKEATTDPKLNETLKELGKNMQEKLTKLDASIQTAFKDLKSEDVKEDFKGTSFENKFKDSEAVLKHWNQLKASLEKDQKSGDFKDDNLKRLTDFLDAVPDKYTKIQSEGKEYLEAYSKGLDLKQKDLVAGNQLTAADEIDKGDENPDGKSFLKSLAEATDAVDAEGKPKFTPEQKEQSERFQKLAQETVTDMREKLTDDEVSSGDMQKYLVRGDFNKNITELKKIYEGDPNDKENYPGFIDAMPKTDDGKTTIAEDITNNFQLIKQASATDPNTSDLNEGLRRLEGLDRPIEAEDIKQNKDTKEFIQDSTNDALEPAGQPAFSFPTEEDKPPLVTMRSEASVEDAVASFTNDSVAFGDFDTNDLVAQVDDIDLDEPLNLDLDLNEDFEIA